MSKDKTRIKIKRCWKTQRPTDINCPNFRIDYEALEKHVNEFPDSTLKERADHFEVSVYGIVYALEKLNITRKKSFGYKERCPKKRATYQAELRQAIEEKNRCAVYVDETGFTAETVREYGYAPRGKRSGCCYYG